MLCASLGVMAGERTDGSGSLRISRVCECRVEWRGSVKEAVLVSASFQKLMKVGTG